MKIHIGTGNPLKVEATRAAFRAAFPDRSIEVAQVAVSSGVPSQPFGAEVAQGAIRRAEKALQDADFGVGIEAGLIKFPEIGRYLNLQICAVVDQAGKLYVGSGPGFELPPQVVESLRHGSTLNREISCISGTPEIKEKEGAIGYLSKGVIDRFEVTYAAVLMALIPYIRRGLFSR